MDTKELEKSIDLQIERYQSITAKGDSIDAILNAKDWFVAQLARVGQKEADVHESKVIAEVELITVKSKAYVDAKARS